LATGSFHQNRELVGSLANCNLGKPAIAGVGMMLGDIAGALLHKLIA
jgi:hypothetical protein